LKGETLQGIEVQYRSELPLTTTFEEGGWESAPVVSLATDWRGEPTPAELETTVRLLWNEEALLLGYVCRYTELDVDADPDPAVERYALWDRDVCEVFIRSPREPHPRHYREFEVAPTGQWCDLIVDRHQMSADWEWRSGMRTLAQVDPLTMQWKVVMILPFAAFGGAPVRGERWQGNLFRISRLQGERRYLTYSPTRTVIPNFHVAEAFVDLHFQGQRAAGSDPQADHRLP
jgi:hypothetical protein